MEAERLTLLAAHSSDESDASDDELQSMHIDLAAITNLVGGQRFAVGAGPSGDALRRAAPAATADTAGGRAAARQPSPRVAGLRDQVAQAPTSAADLEALKARELQAFEDEKQHMMAEIARMEAEAQRLTDEHDGDAED